MPTTMTSQDRPNRQEDYGHRHSPYHNSGIRSSSIPFVGNNNINNNDDDDLLVCHASAHAIVFRDHLRMARKIITHEEVVGNNDGEESSGDSSSDDDDDGDVEGGAEAFKELQSVQNRIRRSITNANEIMNEINHLAHDLVPELESVTLVDFENKLQSGVVSERNIQIEGLYAPVEPLPVLEWNMKTKYEDLMMDSSSLTPQEDGDWSNAEIEVYNLLQNQQACVKTIQQNEWSTFLERFQVPVPNKLVGGNKNQYDIPPSTDNNMTFNSFVTSTSLLPSCGKKMRCYGSEVSYPIGVVFALPTFDETSPEKEEDLAVKATQTWAWPAGYAAKTEFNINNRGELINGREEALVSLSQLRKYNDEYIHSQDHYIAGRIIKGGFNVVPYNECFLRVGGPGRIVNGIDVGKKKKKNAAAATTSSIARTFDKGCGLFVALFIRTITMGDIINLMRTKSRIEQTLGKEHIQDIPLLYLHHEHGVRVFTKKLQEQFWQQTSTRLQPFPNPLWRRKVNYRDTDNEKYIQHKLIEQLDDYDDDDDNDDDVPLNNLTHHQLAKIAGGFGFTDRSFLTLLMNQPDFKHVHDVMQQVFAASTRANDYYTARQSLILYALANTADTTTTTNNNSNTVVSILKKLNGSPASTYSNLSILKTATKKINLPSPLATKRWRRATNNEGLLVVLGAAQILKTITVNSAQRRTNEAIVAVEEWVHHGEDSIAFRVSSWKDQKVDQKDGNIATQGDTQFMAFVTGKSVKNRKNFAEQLRKACPEQGKFTGIGFLKGMYEIVCRMHSPCMRLELLQYILALDNRYSVELIKDSIELAATCLGVITN